ncbi:hypothetical protein KR018_009807, partial [Drosophila ironensis]
IVMASNRHSPALIALTTLWLLLLPIALVGGASPALSSSSSSAPKSVSIELRRRRNFQWNGIELDESSVLEHLREHEKALIFGPRFGKEAPEFKLVHLLAPQEAPSHREDEGHMDAKMHRRRRRRSLPEAQDDGGSDEVEAGEEVGAEVEARLQLQQSPQLIDDAFIFIRRTENGTQFVEHSPQLLKRLERCFYRSPAAALDLCEPGSVRGVFQQNASDFVVHPLPARFGSGTHVLFQARLDKNQHHSVPSPPLDSQLQFEPDAEEFNEPRRRLRAQSPAQAPLRLRFQPRHHHHHNHHQHQHQRRRRRYIGNPPRSRWPEIPEELFVETAIFVDSDLYAHMQRNFPTNTDGKLISFVMAMINGVQLVYHHHTLGRRINFVLKRLEIWNTTEPPGLSRSVDVEQYLNSFCMWQERLNPASDDDPLHYDHALILTGLDLVTFPKPPAKPNSQVVGLAPVAGMCTPTFSCTINEAKNFESVFVVAHEIGHNLGMRHDAKEISCDPTMHIMSPKLGTGKVTWSKCSRTFLEDFLADRQAECLFDRGQFVGNLDHSAGGILPGQRFDANQQCMLRFGKNFMKDTSQSQKEICRDLHCRQDGSRWTSHPPLDGTECGDNMWCRGGSCETRSSQKANYYSHKPWPQGSSTHEKYTSRPHNLPSFLHDYNPAGNELPGTANNWGEWGEPSACESSCLYGASRRLLEGSTGLRTSNRSCLNYRNRCMGRDRRFETCTTHQCHKVAVQTVEDFATKVCTRASSLDKELTGEGLQLSTTPENSCLVFCRTRNNGTKSRKWTFPDGTTCRSKHHSPEHITYCIAGRCELFTCDNSTANFFRMDSGFCREKSLRPPRDSSDQESRQEVSHKRYAERQEGITPRSPHENDVIKFAPPPQNNYIGGGGVPPFKLRSHPKPYIPDLPRAPPPASASLIALDRRSSGESEWEALPGCHSNCMTDSKGIQVVTSRISGEESIQLCSHRVQPCERLLTAAEFAEQTCSRYRHKVRGLSGHGSQISASIDEPDRSCRVGCQDERIKFRYYLVNGRNGHFPLGTRCSPVAKRYCVYGKCLEFGDDDLPLDKVHISLGQLRMGFPRRKRSLPDEPSLYYRNTFSNFSSENIEFNKPIHVSADELSSKSQ